MTYAGLRTILPCVFLCVVLNITASNAACEAINKCIILFNRINVYKENLYLGIINEWKKILICRGLLQFTIRKVSTKNNFRKIHKKTILSISSKLWFYDLHDISNIFSPDIFSVMSSFNDKTYLPKVLNCKLKCTT